MQFLMNAAKTEQTEEGKDLNLNRANRLLRIFTNQMEALKRHRSRGEQRVTVEHVNVRRGGQAVVGPVNLNQCRPQTTPEKGVGHGQDCDQ